MSLESGDSQTTFSRLKAAWGRALCESFQGYGNWKSAWLENGQVLEFARYKKRNPQRLRMADLQDNLKGLVYSMKPALEKLLPEGMKLPTPQVDVIQGSTHREDKFFMDLPATLEMFDPLYQEFMNGHGAIAQSKSSANAWLKKEQEFLCHLLATLLVSGGVSPRTHLAQTCQIRGIQRNIFYISGSLVWISSLSKTNSATQSSGGLWAFPPQVTWPICYYLGVVRPFSIHLLKSMNNEFDSDVLNNYLFVYTSTSNHTQRLWTSKNAQQVIETSFANPLGLKMDCYDLRQILQAVANQHFVGSNGNALIYLIVNEILLTYFTQSMNFSFLKN